MSKYKLFLGVYFSILFSFLLFINLYYLDGIPHVPDSVAYLFMAKMFATGHVILPIPISPHHFDYFPAILSIKEGKWLFQYPFGHPLLLVIGVLIGFPNLIPPIIGALFALFLFLIAKKIYNIKTAYFLLPLPLLSPFFLENASSFMSHNTAALYLVISFYCLILALKNRKNLPMFMCGVFLGLLFNTRPLTSFPFLIIILLIIAFKLKPKMYFLFLFSLGFGFMLMLWLFYNYLTTGNIFTSQYYLTNKGMLPFDQQESLAMFLDGRFQNLKILFNNLGPVLFNWPAIVTYGILLVPFLLRKHTFWDIIFLFSLFTLPIAYFFYDGQFLMYGPRFWYEILPFIILLTARGFGLLYQRIPKTAVFIFAFLIFLSFARLFSFIPTKDPDMMSPLALTRLRGINVIDSRIIKEVKRKNIHNAVIFVEDCQGNWWCYGSVFPQNSPTLDTDIVYLKYLGYYKNQTAIKYFQGRSFYLIDYHSPTIKRIY